MQYWFSDHRPVGPRTTPMQHVHAYTCHVHVGIQLHAAHMGAYARAYGTYIYMYIPIIYLHIYCVSFLVVY